MRRSILVACILLLAPVAGCTGSDDGPSQGAQPTEGEPGANASTGLLAPNWSIGDHWTWSTDQVGEVTYVVTGEAGSDWIVDTTNRDVAFFDARFDVSTLGEVRKDDLAGSQGDERVKFFNWPLSEGKTWTTTWDGVERTITVERVEDGVAHLVARQEGRVAVDYTYDSEAGSFGDLVFLDADGSKRFGMDLRDSGSGFGQPAVRWDLAAAVDESGTFGTQPVSFGFGFTVPDDATDLWLSFSLTCPSGAYDLGFGPTGDAQQSGSGYQDGDTCPADANITEPVVEEPAPGDYRGGFTAHSPQGTGSYDILLYVRTLQEVAVGGS